MISLQQLLLVLVTLGCQQWVDKIAAMDAARATLSITGVVLGFGLLFKMFALRACSSLVVDSHAGSISLQDSTLAQIRCSRARQGMEAAWVVCLPITLLVTGWGGMLQSFQSAGWPQVIIVVAWFVPSLLWIALMELTAAQFDELCSQSPARAWHVNESEGNDLTWPRQWLLRMRLGGMASLVTCVTPVLLIVAFTDAVRYGLHKSLGVDESLAPHLLLGASLSALVCGVFFLPKWMGWWMGVVEFPTGPLRSQVLAQMSALKIRGVKLRLLPSCGRLPGAAIVGWFPRFRELWLGDALLDRLTARQLQMVIMHELAHVNRKHYLWRMFPILLPVGLVSILSYSGISYGGPQELTHSTGGELSGGLVAGLLVSATATIVMLVGVSLMAQQCELDADKTACKLALQVCAWTEGDVRSAARELSEALDQLLQDCPAAARTTWLHPSLQARKKALARDR